MALNKNVISTQVKSHVTQTIQSLPDKPIKLKNKLQREIYTLY